MTLGRGCGKEDAREAKVTGKQEVEDGIVYGQIGARILSGADR